MRIDQVRISEMLKAYEKSRVGSSRKQGGDRDRLPAVRDEVIISTEAKRLMIRDRVVSQVVERLRNLPPSHNPLSEVDVVLEEAARDSGPAPMDPEEKAQIRETSVGDLRRKRALP
ncbi:hypothetical protein [Candidatus Methylomirabilis sp.]|uniref:hypothetical protein n=1 Tax=Candidatus Methylomirabilis sp. TaxID=2032687 RepID=UPI002A63B3DC|nr:hypothetical protein [Candidatus Methylomirabilis sp.]